MNDIMIYYTLLGPKGMLDVLTIEHEDNVLTFMAAINPDNDTVPSNHMKVTVYNMKEFFQQNQVSANDMLLLSIKDYDKKICEVNVLKQETLKDRAWEKAEWLNLLSKGIKKSGNPTRTFVSGKASDKGCNQNTGNCEGKEPQNLAP